MILAADVDYRETSTSIAAITFKHWQGRCPSAIYRSYVTEVAASEPDQFYKREQAPVSPITAEL
ncbi:hypothetical protein ACJJIQ_00715 [Microbulbifer sp. ANSA003]|uniref:hypothetical protein n=1 Tax=Microbulbifer sp. ANSA003 TaxID=3243360 RepID=UPI004042BE05